MSERQEEFFIAFVSAWLKLGEVKRCPPAELVQGLQSVRDDMAKTMRDIVVHYDIKISAEIVEKQPVES
jgi:hypothetical protein